MFGEGSVVGVSDDTEDVGSNAVIKRAHMGHQTHTEEEEELGGLLPSPRITVKGRGKQGEMGPGRAVASIAREAEEPLMVRLLNFVCPWLSLSG
jgi:hypothetical protein